jgi:DNA-binding NarL/FixJ family response regulator
MVNEAGSKSIRIWLVDDNSGFRALLASILNDEVGFECSRQFSCPDSLLRALSREPAPDIILLDIEMGEHNGLDAIRPIKSLAKRTHVLMLTTFAAPESRERAFREGASDFMLKTWPITEIAMHIRQAMEFGSVAGLLTAFLGKGAAREVPQLEPVRKTNGVERWFVSLRGFLKFSPS